MPTITKSIAVRKSAQDAFKFVADFEKYPSFLSQVLEAGVIKKNKKSVRVHFKLNMIKVVEYTLDFFLFPHEKISWKMVRGDMMTKNEGEWIITPLDKNLMDLKYSLSVDFDSFTVRMLFGQIAETRVSSMLDSFKKEMEKTGRAPK